MMRILVGDDDKFIRYLLRKTLDQKDCQIEVVESGSEVIRKILEQKFNLLFLDIHMAGMDGFEAIPLIKEIDPHLPIVVITGDPSHQTRNKIQSLGVFKYLTKPLNPLEIKNTLKAAFSR